MVFDTYIFFQNFFLQTGEIRAKHKTNHLSHIHHKQNHDHFTPDFKLFGYLRNFQLIEMGKWREALLQAVT